MATVAFINSEAAYLHLYYIFELCVQLGYQSLQLDFEYCGLVNQRDLPSNHHFAMSLEAPLHEVILADSSELIAQCIQVRISVFVHEQLYPLELEVDEYDNESTTAHFLLRLLPSKEPIGAIRLYPGLKHPDSNNNTNHQSYPSWKFGRLCVLKPYREFGLGSALIAAGHAWLRSAAIKDRAPDNGVEGEDSLVPVAEVSLVSQVHATGFYARNGYEALGEEFLFDGKPHRAMKIVLYRDHQQSTDK